MRFHADDTPRVSTEVTHDRVYSGDDYGYQVEISRAHNKFSYGELNLADLINIRDGIQQGIDKIIRGEL